MACLLQRGQGGARRAEDMSGSRHAVTANANPKCKSKRAKSAHNHWDEQDQGHAAGFRACVSATNWSSRARAAPEARAALACTTPAFMVGATLAA